MIKRTATVSLKFSTEEKKQQIESLTAEYQKIIQQYIDLIWEDSSLELNKETLALIQDTYLSERFKSNALRQALQICTNTRKSAETLEVTPEKPIFNGTLILDAKFVFISLDAPNSFDGWIYLSTLNKGNRIWLPFKRTRPLNKWLNRKFKLIHSVRVRKYNNNWYADLILEKEASLKQEGSFLGIDSGTKKALSLSDGSHLGDNYRYYIDKIKRKQIKSKNYVQALKERDNYLREEINKIDFASTQMIFVEDLKGIQQNTKKNKKVNKTTRKILSTWVQGWGVQKGPKLPKFVSRFLALVKSSRAKMWQLLKPKTWGPKTGKVSRANLDAPVQGKTFRWLQNKCEENCVGFTFVPAKYTSQTCSRCRHREKSNRNGELFRCKKCSLTLDADHNASLIVLSVGLESLESSIPKAR